MTTAVESPVGTGLRSLRRVLAETEGWADLTAAVLSGKSGTIDGAWGSSASLATATLSLATRGTALVVVANPADLGPWAEDLYSFTGTHPAVFEAWESWPVPPSKSGKLDPTTSSRLRLLQELNGATPPKIVVTTIAAVCQPMPERADLAARGRKVVVGEVVSPSELAEWLVASGYKRVDAVEYPGEFARRGGICDIFPPDAADPVRLEFFGDEVESIRTFAAGSQRSLDKRPAVTLMGITDPSPTPPPKGEGLSKPPSLVGKGVGG